MPAVISYLSGLGGLMVLLFVLGIVLVVVEFIMPGFGVAGTIGILALIAGVVVASQVVSPGVLTLIIAAVLLVIAGMLVWLYKSATKGGRISRLLLLHTKTGKEEGFSSVENMDSLAGREGIAMTVLRPSGTGAFDDMRLDVVSGGDFIPKGSRIRIVSVEGFRIVVEKID